MTVAHLVQLLLEFFLRHGGIGRHALHGGIDFDTTLGSEFFGIAAKLVGAFSPRLQLGRSLKLEYHLLLLDLLAEALNVFLDLGLEPSKEYFGTGKARGNRTPQVQKTRRSLPSQINKRTVSRSTFITTCGG
jgi:hypothetical protein